ncbi:hypothetical protein CWI39_1889p0010 [Hamiltosporidium magnivora]|uniref:Uncharacterized protein n=1 Tax=Hamiltosporidium magnivora TaxID=148818 RepID=A0A4Q9KZC7_9MICR|nr:hypothetical protein CWI39_1889p0010 [Hamiltosporidium magnivora]TBU09535.1 hypothetical protein CWI36_0021p0050 [Hamiltosporidium magnivora]
MAYYKTKFQKKAKNFEFSAESYVLSEEIRSQYKKIKDKFFISISALKNYKSPKKISISSLIDTVDYMKEIISFYEDSDRYISILMTEVFKSNKIETLEKKRELYLLLNKLFKIFFIFDIERHRNILLFHNFSLLKILLHNENPRKRFTDNDILRLTSFAALSQPMAHLFLSYFTSDTLEILHPTILTKRGTLHISPKRKEFLYLICCILCKQPSMAYAFIFFAGLFNRFFHSRHFDNYVEEKDIQKQAYYTGILEMK